MGKNISHHSKPLDSTVRNENKAKISQLLWYQNVVMKGFYPTGDTVLHLAVKKIESTPNEVIEILNIYISRGVDPNIKNLRGETVLHTALARRDKDIIDFLLEHNANINATDNGDNSLAHFFIESEVNQYMRHRTERDVAEKGSIHFVEWLLAKGVDFDWKNRSVQSALQWAVEYNLQHILPTLLRHTNDINFVRKHDKRTLLQLFIKPNHETENQGSDSIPKNRARADDFSKRYAVEVVKILLERGVSVDHVDTDGLTALHLAIYAEEHMDVVELLIHRFTKIKHQSGNKLFHEVVKQATWESPKVEYYSKIMCALIAKGADVNCQDERGMTPVYYAINRWNLRVTEILKENGANFNATAKNGQNPLFWLHQKPPWDKISDDRQEALFDLLVDGGCNVNARDDAGRTPLHLAAKYGNVLVVKKLLAHGAEVNCQDNREKKTPLHLSLGQELSEVTKLLLDHGANVNCRDRCGRRPLHLAVKQGCLESVEYLLDRGADVNCRNSCDGTPLHLAVALWRNNVAMLRVLTRRGAWVNARNDSGESVLAKAMQLGSTDCVEELVTNGADIDYDLVVRFATHGWFYYSTPWLRYWIELRSSFSKMKYDLKSDVDDSKEIKALRSTFIDRHTSLYEWLHLRPNRQSTYSRNEKLRNIVDSPALEAQFPLYFRVIVGHYLKAVSRKSLIEPAKGAWIRFTKVYFPDICTELIFACLDDGDLIDVIGLDETHVLETSF